MKESRFSLKKHWWVILWVLAVVAGLVGLISYTRREGADINITADYMDGGRVSTIGMFTVRGASHFTVDELYDRIVLDPEMEFQLRKNPDGNFTLLTYRSLEPGKRLQIRLLDAAGGVRKTWEFQTTDAFEVTGVFPADGATEVPPSTSVEIKLSYADIDGDIAQYITISPELEFYTSMVNSNLVIFTSGDYFPAQTTIQVTLSGDLPRQNGETLGSDYVFSFTTGPEEDRDFRLSSVDVRVTENILPGDDVLLKLRLGGEMEQAELTTTVYRYAGADAYLEALQSYRDAAIQQQYTSRSGWSLHDYWQMDPTGLEQVMTVTGPAVATDENDWDRSVLLPEPLEPGWYGAIVEATMPSGGKIQASKLIQVSPLSIFHIQSGTVDRDGGSELLAWVNDTETGQPADGAQVRINSATFQAQGITGQDGLATLRNKVKFLNRYGDDTGENDWYRSDRAFGLLEVRAGEQIFHDVYGQSEMYYLGAHNTYNDYTGYLFTDRPIYRHTDTVKAWGIVTPWKDTPMPTDLYLEGHDGAVKVPIQPREDGTFQTEFQLEALSGGGLWLRIQDEDGVTYGDLWLKLEEYVKPAYQTTATPDRPIFAAWEDYGLGEGWVGLDFTAHYFEGTPARGYTAVAREPEDSYINSLHFSQQELVTDADGNARVALLPDEVDEYYESAWRPFQVTYAIFSDAELDAPQVQGGTFYYLNRDLMLTLEKGEGDGSVTARVNHMDYSAIQSEADVLNHENLRGAPATAELTAEIHKVWNEKIPDGTRYDVINKQSVTAYRYEHKDEVVDTRTGVSTDGVFTFTDLPTEDEASFYVAVSTLDTRGEPVSEELYYSQELIYRSGYGSHSYRLQRREEEDAQQVIVGDIYGQYFQDGETLELYLSENGVDYADPDGKVLYVVAQDEIIDYGFAPADTFQLPFSEDLLPNYHLAGAYFDGKRVYALTTSAMVFDPAGRELDIEIQPERERYSPGDTAQVSLKVTEKESGQAAAGANLVAAVVDEAVFALQEQEPDFLRKYYRHKSFSYLMKYTSYDNKVVDGGGMGGGGPEPFTPRVDFPDTAAFVELTTDENGTVSFPVSLPDNLTSWRVTALALSQDKKAGDNKGNFSVGKDFFITPVLPPRLLAGDDLTITVHSAGAQVNPGDSVRYTCSIEGIEGTYTATGRAGDFTPIPLDQIPGGSLPSGDYQMTVSGEWNGVGDGVILPLSVVDSGVSVSVTERMPLDQAASLQSQAWPVQLGFYDKESELAVRVLSFLASQDGARVDQKMARRYATEQMLASGADVRTLDTALLADDFRIYAPDYQGYRLFPYSEESEVLTARIWLMAREYFSGGSIYGLENLPDDPAERAATYLLQSDWEPLASRDEIVAILEQDTFSFREKMFLVASLGDMGMEEEASGWYEKLSAPLRTETVDGDGNPIVSISGSGADTAAASMVVNQLGLPDSDGMARYLLDAPAVDDVYLLELMYYLQQHPAAGGKAASVTYTRDGETVTERLDSGYAYQSFTKDQLASADLRAEGDVWVSAVYTADLEKALDRDNSTLALTKTIEPAQAGGTLKQGDLAKITLRLEIPSGVKIDQHTMLEIQDYIPTGMRYESMDGETGWYLSRRDDQRVTFGALREQAGELVYYARCVTPGSYVVESAFGSTATGSAWASTQRQTVEIAP